MSITSRIDENSIEDQVWYDWNAAPWYQAATLRERLQASPPPQLLQKSSIQKQSYAQGQARLQFWQEEFPLQQEDAFAERLALDGLNEAGLQTLLSERPEHLKERLIKTPFVHWLSELQQAFEHTRADGMPPSTLAHDPQRRIFSDVLETVHPLLAYGRKRLQAAIALLQERYPGTPFGSISLVDLFFPTLAGQVYTILLRTLILEMHVARLQGYLQGESPEERLSSFLSQLAERERILSLLQEYPVLARRLIAAIERWVGFSLEVLTHLCQDWRDICEHFFSGEDPGPLSKIYGNEGDTHRGGRRVIKLGFASGKSLIYKPKSLAVDIHFQELLAWCNQQGETLPFHLLRLLDRGSYGWSECVYARSCSSEAEIERFYERQGSYLALLHVLQATDLHAENLIAAGEHPMLIDLETLFHPHIEKIPDEQPGLRAIKESVLRIALLPQRLRSTDEGSSSDMSGLGGRKGQLFPYRVSVWKAQDTDQMHIKKERVAISGVQNQPALHGHEVNLLNYSPHIITGFSRMYRFLARRREAFATEILPRFAHDEIRIVLRSTFVYGMLLSDMQHPDLLHDALDTERVFDRLWIPTEQQAYLKRVIAAERADLLNGDVPMFTTRPDSRGIFTSERDCIAGVCAETGMEAVERCLYNLKESDLDQQIWFIRASLATLQTTDDQRMSSVLTLEEPVHPSASTLQTRLLAAARKVGDRLCHMAVNRNERAGWLGVAPISGDAWGISMAGADLYNGVPGIVLFLSYLGALTGNTGYTNQARRAMRTLRDQVAQLKLRPEAFSLGAFSGWGGLIYLFSHLGSLWSDDELFSEAEQLAELLRPHIMQDTHFDIIAGSAGCIGALLSLYAVHPSQKVLECALACGQHLLDQAQTMQEGLGWQTIPETPPLSGLSHGASGIALSLCRLAVASGEIRFLHAAQSTLAYERSLFSPELQNWLDLRDFKQRTASDSPHTHTMMAWCHGAPGIGLARLGLRNLLDDPSIEKEARIALQATMAAGFGWNHSLCHGDLGNLETILMASQSLGDREYEQQLEKRTEQLLSSIERNGWITSAPGGVETPGLMIGLAGIGYELLRLARPQQVPSLLLLSPPISAR